MFSSFLTIHSIMFPRTMIISILLSSIRMESYHHSSSGTYYVNWKEYGPCPPEKRGTNEIFTDTHFSKKNRKMEIVGKTTLLIPFDDDITTNINFAIQGTNAAWLPNYFNLQLTKACSTLLNYLREGWTDFLKTMNISAKCPVPKGIYEAKGSDVNDILRRSIFPKEFIFGRYRMTIEFMKKKKLVGCSYLLAEINPYWQKKSKQRPHN